MIYDEKYEIDWYKRQRNGLMFQATVALIIVVFCVVGIFIGSSIVEHAFLSYFISFIF